MKKLLLSFFLVIFFCAAWFSRYAQTPLSAVTPETIQVEVKGAVKAPGIYTLKYRSSLQDAVDEAGGLLPEGDLSALNTLRILNDGEVVVIGTKEADLISINTASLEELCRLKGIGPALAQRIIDYRQEHPFSSLDELTNVKGIGEKIFAGLKEEICL